MSADIRGGQLLIVTLPWPGRAPAAPANLDGTALPGEEGKVLTEIEMLGSLSGWSRSARLRDPWRCRV